MSTVRPALEVELLDTLESARAIAPAWDELAVGQALPLCAPGWMLAWWEHMAPAGAELRVLAIRERGELLALAPWFAGRGEHGRTDIRFLGAENSDRVDILCVPDREPEVRDALLGAIRELRPRPDLIAFEAVPARSQWTKRLAGGGLLLSRYRNSVLPAPSVALPAGPPDAWLAGRSSNFRSQMRRMRRRLEQRGGQVRQVLEPGELEGALDALLRLHLARWEGRAPSGLARAGMSGLLLAAAHTLGPDRLRLWIAEIDGEPISVQLFHAAGGQIKYWNGGWMEQHADLKPTMLTILAALEDGIARGEHSLDLGAGMHPYKQRFADGNDPLAWGGLVVRNRRLPRTRAELLPRVLRYRSKQAVEALPAPLTEPIATLVRARRGAEPAD
ncbi:MAG TPA: GNAT family N-acetyltransferase [Solirubrobacteraceae bacterium]|jgi:CelD/BcsL family acetyltransferase involved in cellulose biosynthesis|nr:GNAT family N-acetyltransferase [Solirubrobacteraceae bacterium]